MKKTFVYAGVIITMLLYTCLLNAQSSSISKVIDAFSKTVKDNQNDTSSADLTMKALGNLMGGGGVSKADSATAIKTFTIAKGGSGVFYQYLTTVTSTQRGTNYDTSAIYFTTNGEGRSEKNLPAMMGIKGGNKLVILQHADQIHYSLTLNADQKTYSLNVIDTSLINASRSNYQVTVIGTENVQGYNCIHAKMMSTLGSGMFKSSSTMDIWTSTEVPGYSFVKTKLLQNVTAPMMRALEKAGCSGFMVKMTSQSKDFIMNMTLVKAQLKSFPSSIFQIPAGYTESDENIIYQMNGAKK